MSLFQQLRRLHLREKFQLEDFHTEIVAQVLRELPELALKWLRSIGATSLEVAQGFSIVTQEEFAALEDHLTDSRPDIVIRLTHESRTELILVESKIGARAGYGQLERYLDHLGAEGAKGKHQTTLVFVTRDFEADYARKFSSLPSGVVFRQTRWFEFYRLLCQFTPANSLAKHLADFMHHNRMHLRTHFRSVDIVALENFRAARSLMNETLAGKVSQSFAEKFGHVTKLSKSMQQLRDHGRYIVYTQLSGALEILLGYWLPNDEPGEEVWIGIHLQTAPGLSRRKQMAEAYRSWCSARDGWEAGELNEEKLWCGMWKGTSLTAFGGADDQIEAIRAYFLGLLDEANSFKIANPEIPWRVTRVEDEPEEAPVENVEA